MAKRRSSTRVGRKNPRPLPLLRSTVAVATSPGTYRIWRPVLLQGVVYRVLESRGRQFEVEEWSGHYWLPSLLPLYRVREAELAPEGVLQELGVPTTDWADRRPHRWEVPELKRLTNAPQDAGRLDERI